MVPVPMSTPSLSRYRSPVAASLLKRHGRDDIINVAGGMTAWKKADLPTEK